MTAQFAVMESFEFLPHLPSLTSGSSTNGFKVIIAYYGLII